MARSNPGVGPLKPHIRKHKPGGIWIVTYRDSRGAIYGATEVTWMTANAIAAHRCRAWCRRENEELLRG